MKYLKTIIISVAATLLITALVLSIVYNNLILKVLGITDVESFKRVMFCQELLESLQQSFDTGVESDVPNTDVQRPVEDSEIVAPSPDTYNTNDVIYEDVYIRVTYVKQELSIFGPTIKFLIENKTTKTIDVSFTNVHIDGYMVDFCGVYVDALGSGRKTFETLYLYESDYKDFTNFPSFVEFNINIQDTESWYDLVKDQTIYIKVNS